MSKNNNANKRNVKSVSFIEDTDKDLIDFLKNNKENFSSFSKRAMRLLIKQELSVAQLLANTFNNPPINENAESFDITDNKKHNINQSGSSLENIPQKIIKQKTPDQEKAKQEISVDISTNKHNFKDEVDDGLK